MWNDTFWKYRGTLPYDHPIKTTTPLSQLPFQGLSKFPRIPLAKNVINPPTLLLPGLWRLNGKKDPVQEQAHMACLHANINHMP